MKKILSLILLLLVFLSLVSCKDNTNVTKADIDYTISIKNELSEVAKREERKCFNFFYATANTDENSGGYGLIPDRYPSNGLSSIASVGFGLTAIPIGIENGWISKENGYERVLKTFDTLDRITTVHGFYYHFYNEKTGFVASGSEVSNIDTSILLCGALFCGEYFGDLIKERAQEIYDRVEWTWFLKSNNQFAMSATSNGTLSGAWNHYAEQLMMYFLGAGSNTYPINKKVYDSFTKQKVNYEGYEIIYSWFGSIFTYQFSHAWIDFRKILDPNGIDYYKNSENATMANYLYCQKNKSIYKGFDKGWGLTACDGPDGYSGLYGASPSGSNSTSHRTDGTIPPCGAIGSICFAPELVLETMDYYYNLFDGKLFGGYGFYDAYNMENGVWIATDVIGIDKGISLLMLENYQSEFVWNVFMNCDFMSKAIKTLGFTYR